ncbi:MAG: sigma 54-interacting transcriptional regulator [Acidobacteriota bacterium]
MSQRSDETWIRHLHSETRTAPGLGQAVAEARVPGLTILAHPDSRRVGERVALPELASGKEVLLSRLEPLFAAPDEARRRPLADPFVSRRPIRLAPAPRQGVRLQTEDSKGALTVDGRLVDGELRLAEDDLERGVVLGLAQRVALVFHRLHPSPPRGVPRFEMVGESPAFLQLRRDIAQVAELAAPVLLRGETGCGKELAARALHDASSRRSEPFLAVNVGALPASLAAAELFGAARGAFTGADRQRRGTFARADGGTLLLDEIGEAPPEIQVALLRVLEEGEVTAVGSGKPRRVDVRVIAATDADLEAKIAEGTFRAPLLHRLGAHEIRLPPLRQRRDDIGRLLIHFLRQELAAVADDPGRLDAGPQATPWLPADLVARLAVALWPGNVRQLRNVARRLVASGRDRPQAWLDDRLEAMLAAEDAASAGRTSDDADTELSADTGPPAEPAGRSTKTYRPAFEVSEDELLATLRAHRFQVQPTAAALGVSRTALYGLINESEKVRKPRQLSRDTIERSRERCGGNIEAMVEDLEVSRKGLRRRMTELGMP